MPDMVKGVSIIVCCYNSVDRLPQTLLCLSRQKTDMIPWEVVVVDNCSTDKTISIARETWPLKLKNKLKVVKETKPGLVFARIKGLNVAKYSIVSFVDDDNWVKDNWIKTVVEIMEKHPEVGVCGSLNKPVLKNKPPAWFKRYAECYAVGRQGKKGDITWKRGFVWGAGLTLRKSAWAGLYEQGFRFFLTDSVGRTLSAGGDSELCFALRLAGWKIWYEPKLQLSHYLSSQRLQWKQLRKMFRSFGVGRAGHDPYFFAQKTKHPAFTELFKEKWYSQSLLIIFKLASNPFKLIMSQFVLLEGDNDVLKIEHGIGHLLFLFSKRRDFNTVAKDIRNSTWFL